MANGFTIFIINCHSSYLELKKMLQMTKTRVEGSSF